MGSSPQRVLREVLTIGFRSYPRAASHEILFAILTVVLMWDGMPHGFFFIPRLCSASAQGVADIASEIRALAQR